MKLVKKLAAALLLASALTVSAYAGDQHTPAAVPSPTPAPMENMVYSAPTDETQSQTTETATDTGTEELLLNSLIFLFSLL